MNEIFIRRKLEEFLLEDLGHTEIIIEDPPRSIGVDIIAEEEGIFCGGILIAPVFDLLTPIQVMPFHLRELLPEGVSFVKGDTVASFSVNIEVLRHGIRTMLNLLAHLSGIATETRRRVKEIEGFSCALLDTRKTTPGLRAFEKYAVRTGGGKNHRFGRFDGLLIKKEDIKIDGGIKNAVDRAWKTKSHLIAIEVEVETLEELEEVLKDARVAHVLLDNMDIATLKKAVKRCGKTHALEASGIGDKNLRDVASTGVRYISLSSLTRGVKPIKMKLKLD